MRSKIKKIVLVICTVSICCFLTGCGDKSLYSQEEVISKVEASIPNAKFVKMENEIGVTKFGENIYTFSNGEFEFKYNNYMIKDVSFGGYYNEESTTYLKELINYKKNDIEKIMKKNNLYWYEKNKDENLETVIKDNKNKIIYHDHYDRMNYNVNYYNIELYVNDFSEIDKICTFLGELKDILYDYIPEKRDDLEFEIVYQITTHKLKKENSYIYSGKLEKSTDIKNINETIKHEYNRLFPKTEII